MLRHFPDPHVTVSHRSRDYFIAGFTFLCVAVALLADANAPLAKQNALGVCGWVFLIGWLLGECKYVRMQVMIAVTFATIGENFASVYMEGYIYRFGNVPAYVPPGHGMVYLTAVALGRSGLFQRYAREIATFVVIIGGLWSIWGISGFASQRDGYGAALFCVFLGYLFKGRSPMVYLSAFFITTWLELIGTGVGTWKWAEIDPISGLTQGNPPSGVAAWYCFVDAVAMTWANPVLHSFERFFNFLKLRLKGVPAKEYAFDENGAE